MARTPTSVLHPHLYPGIQNSQQRVENQRAVAERVGFRTHGTVPVQRLSSGRLFLAHSASHSREGPTWPLFYVKKSPEAVAGLEPMPMSKPQQEAPSFRALNGTEKREQTLSPFLFTDRAMREPVRFVVLTSGYHSQNNSLLAQ